MSKAFWGWLALMFAIAGVYTLVDGLTNPGTAITAGGNALAEGVVLLILSSATLIRFFRKTSSGSISAKT